MPSQRGWYGLAHMVNSLVFQYSRFLWPTVVDPDHHRPLAHLVRITCNALLRFSHTIHIGRNRKTKSATNFLCKGYEIGHVNINLKKNDT